MIELFDRWKFRIAIFAVGAWPMAWIGLRLWYRLVDWLESGVPVISIGDEG